MDKHEFSSQKAMSTTKHRPPARSTKHVSIKTVLDRTNTVADHRQHAQAFRARWDAIRVSDPTIGFDVWSHMFDTSHVPGDAIPYVDKCYKTKPLYKFRTDLAEYISSRVCTFPVTCKSYGSTKASSDIDVTIDGNILHIRQGLLTYIVICKFLREIFSHDPIFQGASDSFDIKKVFHFFDINFYLSNFAIKKHESLPDDMLSSYHLSTSYTRKRLASEGDHSKNQYYYAFVDIVRKNDDVNGDSDTTIAQAIDDVYLNKINKINILLTHDHEDSNVIVDNLSIVSTFEDECYHTQGAFFHVVMMMQRKIQFRDIREHLDVFVKMMYASAMENLSFAFTHYDTPTKRNKYIDRYNDALERISAYVPAKELLLKPIDAERLRSSNPLHSMIRKAIQNFV